METNDTWAFVYSTRFWAMILTALSVYLGAKGVIGSPEMLLIATITGGFWVTRTIDRNVETFVQK